MSTRRRLETRRGLIAGCSVALFGSLSAGLNAEQFWGPFLKTLTFSLACVALVVWFMVRAQRSRESRS